MLVKALKTLKALHVAVPNSVKRDHAGHVLATQETESAKRTRRLSWHLELRERPLWGAAFSFFPVIKVTTSAYMAALGINLY